MSDRLKRIKASVSDHAMCHSGAAQCDTCWLLAEVERLKAVANEAAAWRDVAEAFDEMLTIGAYHTHDSDRTLNRVEFHVFWARWDNVLRKMRAAEQLTGDRLEPPALDDKAGSETR